MSVVLTAIPSFLTVITTMSMSVVQLESLSFLDSLDSPATFFCRQLSSRSLFRSASFIVRNSNMLRTTSMVHGIRCTNSTRNLQRNEQEFRQCAQKRPRGKGYRSKRRSELRSHPNPPQGVKRKEGPKVALSANLA